jgi:hypothetical protein
VRGQRCDANMGTRNLNDATVRPLVDSGFTGTHRTVLPETAAPVPYESLTEPLCIP